MVNFGIIYAISAFGLSQRLGIPRKEASELIENYFVQYPKLKNYMNDTLEFARANGYVKTIMGRRRYLKDINSRNFTVRGFAEREAINAPLQGSAADLIKLAMINIYDEFKKLKLKTRMTLQVHDELVFDAHKSELEIIKSLIIMYHEIHRLRNTEGFSIQRIADYLSLNFRTVKKYLDLSETEFDIYMEKERVRPCLLEPYRDYVKDYLSKYEDTPSAVMHDKLKEQFPSFPKVDPKTVYNFVMMIRNENGIPKVSCSERQYSAVPDLPPGEQAQVDFGEKKLRTSTGIWVS